MGPKESELPRQTGRRENNVLTAGRSGPVNQPVEAVSARGRELLDCAALNKDTAFTEDERTVFGIRGLLPWRVMTIEEQVAIELEHLRRKGDDLEQYIGLAALQNRNETLFYRLLVDHLEELAPIIYTPTVGRACREYSHVVRRTRGVWITPDDIDHIPEMLRNTGQPGVRLIVVTDNERILGLGDQGTGGMGIPIGKLALYVAGAGLHPRLTLPVSLDCGTDNEELLHDPLYQGYPKRRLRGDAYVASSKPSSVRSKPFTQTRYCSGRLRAARHTIGLLDHYRHRLPCFNDDIQGTAGVVCAGILAALRHRGEKLSAQRLVLLGSGAAGIGIARLIQAIIRSRATPRSERDAVTMLDSQGLLFNGHEGVQDDKRPFTLTSDEFRGFGFEPSDRYDLETVIRHVAPTILIGTSGKPGVFTEAAIPRRSRRGRQSRLCSRFPTPLPTPKPRPLTCLHGAMARRWWRLAARTRSRGARRAHSCRRTGEQRLHLPGRGTRSRRPGGASEVTDRMFLVTTTTLAEMVQLSGSNKVPSILVLPSFGRSHTRSR